ncbi:MAG TPA: S41 family peptidase [Gemmataceae bacterium]|nr:S41 family peptidase [Gemmataceae bacterium]
MISPRRASWAVALLIGSAFLLSTSRAYALPEKQIRLLIEDAERSAARGEWEKARDTYEWLLTTQKDTGFSFRQRYHLAQRRLLQTRRHLDLSYRKEVLSIEYGSAVRIYNVIGKTLLDSSIEKKKIDATKLFKKGLEELDAALANPVFVKHHIPEAKQGEIPTFRALLKKTWGDMDKLSRKDAAKQIGEIAMAAEAVLDLNATVVAMEFACGACYAIDDYTAYLTPNQLRELTRSLSRTEVIDVGLTLDISGSAIVVHEVAMDSLAKGAVKPSDHIISVDKKSVVDLPLQTVKEMLKGPAGSFVEVEVMTPGESGSRLLRLQRRRAVVLNTNCYPSLKNSAYWHLDITSFTENTVQELDVALETMQKANMKGLVLDLRGNGGGIFDSAIDSARRFLSTGIITSTQHQNPALNFVYQAKNPKALMTPMVVLVNADTASAAELLAGALKDNNRGTLIGQTTFGKGCTQAVLELPKVAGGVPTGGMRLTVARFFSPKGQPYCGRGVTPHIFLDDAMVQSQSTMMSDPYHDRAINELDRLLAMSSK